jgi:hypothetical protein
MRRDDNSVVWMIVGILGAWLLFSTGMIPYFTQKVDVVPSGFVDLNEIQKEYTVLNSTIQARNAQITDLQTHVTKLEAANEGLIGLCVILFISGYGMVFGSTLMSEERKNKKRSRVKIEVGDKLWFGNDETVNDSEVIEHLCLDSEQVKKIKKIFKDEGINDLEELDAIILLKEVKE